MIQIDDVINELNKKHVFKIVAFLVLSFPTFQNHGQLQSMWLALIIPNHTCQYQFSVTKFNISKDQCSININGSIQRCTKWNFSSEPVGTTMMSDYGLVCDKKDYGDYFLIIWYSSSFMSMLMGWLSDKYGRKKIVILNVVIETVSSILLGFAPNVAINMILRFFIGVSASSGYISFIWLMESVDKRFRNILGSFFWMFGCIAYMVFPWIVYATKNWRYTQLYSIIPSLFYTLIYFIPESPRWLFVMSKRKEGMNSLKRISKINKVRMDFMEKDIVIIEEKNNNDILDACKSFAYISRMILIFLLLISTGLLYNGVTINISILSSNIILLAFLSGVMGTPALFLCFFTLYYFSRKKSIVSFGILAGSLFCVTVLLNFRIYWQSIVRIILGSIGNVLIATSDQIANVYAMELFPTSHRSFAFAAVHLAGFFSFLGAIYINKLSQLYNLLPMILYLIFVIISDILIFCLLPETKNLPIPETLEDQQMLKIRNEDNYCSYMKNKSMQNNDNRNEETVLINQFI